MICSWHSRGIIGTSDNFQIASQLTVPNVLKKGSIINIILLRLARSKAMTLNTITKIIINGPTQNLLTFSLYFLCCLQGKMPRKDLKKQYYALL